MQRLTALFALVLTGCATAPEEPAYTGPTGYMVCDVAAPGFPSYCYLIGDETVRV